MPAWMVSSLTNAVPRDAILSWIQQSELFSNNWRVDMRHLFMNLWTGPWGLELISPMFFLYLINFALQSWLEFKAIGSS